MDMVQTLTEVDVRRTCTELSVTEPVQKGSQNSALTQPATLCSHTACSHTAVTQAALKQAALFAVTQPALTELLTLSQFC